VSPAVPDSLIVEFAGLPGAGKTTVANSTNRTLLAAGVPSRVCDQSISASVPVSTRTRRRLALAGAELSHRPVQGLVALRAVRRLAPATSRDALAGAAQWLAVQRLEARATRAPGVHLLQEGRVQTLWTLALRARGDRDELRRLARPPEGLLLVVVDAPVALLCTRLAARASQHSRTQLLPERERVAELVAGQGLLWEILAASGRGHLVVVNDGRESPELLGRRVAGWVLRATS
jgi:hypothetical protein